MTCLHVCHVLTMLNVYVYLVFQFLKLFENYLKILYFVKIQHLNYPLEQINGIYRRRCSPRSGNTTRSRSSTSPECRDLWCHKRQHTPCENNEVINVLRDLFKRLAITSIPSGIVKKKPTPGNGHRFWENTILLGSDVMVWSIGLSSRLWS